MTEQPYAHYCQTTGEIRTYSHQQGYKNRDLHDAFVNVIWTADNTAMLRGASGTLHVKAMLAICKTLQQQGAEKLIIKRRKGKRVPFGELIKSTEYEDTFLVDLSIIEALK